MSFADPWVLWVGLPLLALWLVLFVRRTRAAASLQYSSVDNVKRLRRSRTLVLRRIVETGRLAVLALLLVALARPQVGRREVKVSTDGIDIMLVIDTSTSMEALDLDKGKPVDQRRNRLAVVKDVVERFIERRPNDQIGMVVFGSQAFTQCPLTLDHGVLATFLDRVQIGVAGGETAIGDGLATGVKRLAGSKAKSRVVVLLTDGEQTAGMLPATKAAEIAASLGVKVYTVGAGTRGRAPRIVQTVFGRSITEDEVRIDEDTLRRIAELTGGAYFRAEDAIGLESVYSKIDELEKSEITSRAFMEYEERYPLFVVPAIGLLLGQIALLGTRLRKLP